MRKFWLAAATTALLLSGCAETPDPATKEGAPAAVATTNATVEPVPTETVAPTGPVLPSPPPGEAAADCGAPKVAQFVGRQDRPTTRVDLAKAVGHNNIRWLGPDDVVTMDYNAERLNVLLGADKRLITGVRCG